MSTITGFVGGIVFTIVALVVSAKPLATWAAKRSMKNLLGNVQVKVNDLVKNIPIERDPNKLIEDKNVKKKESFDKEEN